MPKNANDASERLLFVVDEEAAGQRLDVALAMLTGVARAQIRRWIDAGRVTHSGRPALRASQSVVAGDVLEATCPEPVAAKALPEEIPLRVLYEDADLVVVDKAAGMVVHPAPGHPSGTLVNALLHHCGDLAGVGGVLRPGIVHRLDRGTSGVMLAAKNDAAHRALARQFHDHTIDRRYQAFVRGVPRADTGKIDWPIGRHPRDRKRMSVRSRSARPALTLWRLLERYPASQQSHLEVRPETGRTHQIRVHLSSAGLPIAGDAIYGKARHDATSASAGLGRPALHAAVLGIAHPRTGQKMSFEAALPEDLQRLHTRLRESER